MVRIIEKVGPLPNELRRRDIVCAAIRRIMARIRKEERIRSTSSGLEDYLPPWIIVYTADFIGQPGERLLEVQTKKEKIIVWVYESLIAEIVKVELAKAAEELGINELVFIKEY